ncbi:tudor domain-containing protein 15 [Pelobates fuscus]|uniref:tudor domain-containing protein 15 n=1 Tax=Pelobates fuscus TaxID=191477 RepID=UPI002FE433A3
MDLKISFVNCQSNDILVKFQGKYISDCELDYHILQNEIQLAPKVKANTGIGEFCLIQDKPFGTWNRGKILDIISGIYEVLLIDQGNVVKVSSCYIASASGELFNLPPKVVSGIVSNILPTGEKWTPKAVNYFSSLVGLQIRGHVQTFLPHQVVLLEIPKVINYSIELNLAKYIDSNSFCLLVDIIHKFPTNSNWKQMPDLLQQRKIHSDFSLRLSDNPPSFKKVLDHLKPNLSLGTTEKVRISAAMSTDRFYCRLLSWEEDLNNLTASMTSHYEAINAEQNTVSDYFGVLCAAKRRDGLWHRGVIHKLISGEEVRIWFMDIGSYETMSSSNMQKLQLEFLSLPMMAIPCSLAAVSDQTESTRNMQLMQIKQGLLGNIIIAHINQFCSEEHLYYVTLYEKDYELNVECQLSNEHVSKISEANGNFHNAAVSKKEERKQSPVSALTETENDDIETITYKTIQMDVDSVHVVFVEYILNPSNFWIRTDDCQHAYSAMMEDITKLYDSCGPAEKLLEDLVPGQLCCALYTKDRHYYRAVITEIMDLEVTVYFLDFGNTETVDRCNVKTLLPQFTILPALAMCCTLAYAYPVEDVWVKSANDYFKQIVSDKPLFCHVLAKQKYKYVVDIRNSESSENSNIVALMVQAGFAEIWKIELNPAAPNMQSNSRLHKTVKLSTQIAPKDKSSDYSETWDSATTTEPTITYKQYTFKPGTAVGVNVSHVNTPADFWCQQLSKSSQLNVLMLEIQKYYSTCRSMYQPGQIACVAKRICDGIFYRASVTNQTSGKKTEVLFVDYGFLEKVQFSELREIKSHFLKLEGQAFRCSLNAVAPVWTSAACRDFKKFVQATTTNLKCTIYALYSGETSGLCNAVKLENPYKDACQYLVEKGHAVVVCDTIQSVNLHTFCYSDFGIKVGDKEQVYVTYFYNSGKFYCQLARNTSVIEELMENLSRIGEKIKPEECTGKKSSLCIVKYSEDGNYYRAVTCPVTTSSCFGAFFVDFGNNQMVTENERLPIPGDAADILCVPMQAIQCSFFDLRDTIITPKVKKWFEDHCIGKLLKAVVVAKNSDGQLELELYDGKILINQKIKDLLGTSSHIETSEMPVKPSNGYTENGNTKTNTIQCKPRGKQSLKPDLNGEDPTISNQIPMDTNLAQKSKPRSDRSVKCKTSELQTLKKTVVKCSDLPQENIEPGTTLIGYTCHINNPDDFYIQLAEHEETILLLAEDLNKENASFQVISVNDLKTGSLVIARYPEDLALYRAVIKEVKEEHVFEVEFIDYGNTANVDSSNIFMLPDNFLTTPKLSIHASLSGLDDLQTSDKWSENMLSSFSDLVNSKPLSLTFISVLNSWWKICLTYEGKTVADEFISLFRTSIQKSPSVSKEYIPELCLAVDCEKAVDMVGKIESDHPVPSQSFQPSQLEKVKCVFFSDCGIFFVTLEQNSQESNLTSLISSTVHKADNRLVVKNITEGMVCLAKSVKMEMWFRATVEKTYPDKMKMLVFFIDHGTRETISMHNAKMLEGDILNIPKQAVACKWVWAKNVDEASFRKAVLSNIQKNIQVLFLDFMSSDSAWKVEVLISGSLLMEHFHNRGFAVYDKCNVPSTCDNSGALSFPKLSVPVAQFQFMTLYPVFVTAANDPSDFCLQLDDCEDTINNLSEMMANLPSEIPSLPSNSLALGCVCLLKCFSGKEWCRVEIVGIVNNFILLNLLDYGVFKKILYVDSDALKIIPKELASFPALTYHCTLHGVIPHGSHWSKEATDFFLQFVKKHDTMIQFIKTSANNKFEVCIYGEGQGRLAYQLVSKGHARHNENEDPKSYSENVLESDMKNLKVSLFKNT